MASLSLTEKLSITGAFLAVVAVAVGTEDDPGVVVASPDMMRELRPAVPTDPPPVEDAPAPIVPSTSNQAATATDGPSIIGAEPENESESGDGEVDAELGRVPLDFSNGPPGT